ncbi:Mitochondrial import inner membrane translocase subunit tim50 [Cladophialophora carrionii]|uniref:Mitochondrial import inner membrane translocase subunit TIM50 n=1 Tax=Cladophialophora carrionii TaxID=86049 RepID=A0A1C1C773_9EURO|nr:Mitochondrial import inner membrane translocase subunit tim50 [Cladophialophora carrionii]
MLRRAALPLLRGRTGIRSPILQAQVQTQLRYYAKGDRPRDPGYQAPESTKQPLPQKEPLRKVPFVQSTPSPNAESASPPSTSPSSDASGKPESRPDATPFGEDPARDLDDVSESVSRASGRSLRQEEGRPREVERDATGQEPTFTSEPREADPAQQPLPDLTKGIPSTLDAELRNAQSRQAAAHASSLNITEDPAEELPAGARGRDGGDTPREEYVSSSDRRKNAAFRYMYIILGLGIVGGSIYMGRNWADEEEEKKHQDAPSGWGFTHFYNRVTARLGDMMSYYRDPVTTKLLPDEDPDPNFRFPFVLVVSLEDMLVHSEWTREKGWRIAKRPGVDYFLRYLSAYYEIVLFTSQPSAVVDQVIRKLDPFSMIRWPLFREATLYKDGGYIKDLSYLNRDLKKVIIMDTDPHHVKHQPENAIILPKWTGDPKDQTLVQFIPFLEYLATMGFEDTREVLKSFEGTYIPAEFARREKLLRAKFEAEQADKGKKRPKKTLGALSSVLGISGRSPDGLDSGEEGKMLWDQIRERGQKQYMELEKKIQEEGAKFLADREAEEKKYQEEMYKSMKPTGWFSGLLGGGQKEAEK